MSKKYIITTIQKVEKFYEREYDEEDTIQMVQEKFEGESLPSVAPSEDWGEETVKNIAVFDEEIGKYVTYDNATKDMIDDNTVGIGELGELK